MIPPRHGGAAGGLEPLAAHYIILYYIILYYIILYCIICVYKDIHTYIILYYIMIHYNIISYKAGRGQPGRLALRLLRGGPGKGQMG